MTKKQKLEAIITRLKEINVDIEPDMISCLVISKYLSEFQKKNIIEGELVMTDSGNRVVSLCEEFGWNVTDKEIRDYVTALITTEDNDLLISELIEYRDNPVEFMEKIDASE